MLNKIYQKILLITVIFSGLKNVPLLSTRKFNKKLTVWKPLNTSMFYKEKKHFTYSDSGDNAQKNI